TGLGLDSNPYADEGEAIQHSFDGQIKGRFGLLGQDHEVVLGALHSVQNRETNTFAALNALPAAPWFPPAGDFNNWTGASYPYPGFATTPFLAVKERVKQSGV